MANILTHVPHPHIERRKGAHPPRVADQLAGGGLANRFNAFLALKITAVVGTMWCAYAFAGLALISLPAAIDGGVSTTVTWTAQTFLQLVLLSIIIVGQNIQASAADARAQATYEDADAVLHTALAIQQHMEAQDLEIERILSAISALQTS
jgi:hypothetical protein